MPEYFISKLVKQQLLIILVYTPVLASWDPDSMFIEKYFYEPFACIEMKFYQPFVCSEVKFNSTFVCSVVKFNEPFCAARCNSITHLCAARWNSINHLFAAKTNTMNNFMWSELYISSVQHCPHCKKPVSNPRDKLNWTFTVILAILVYSYDFIWHLQ